jgi:hypothetical protein
MSDESQSKHLLELIKQSSPELVSLLVKRDAAFQIDSFLKSNYPANSITGEESVKPWELAGLYLMSSGRFPEALGVFWSLYLQMTEAQIFVGRIHKGMPLVWMSECFRFMGYPVHAKRYVMLTLCEDALRESGNVSPEGGSYFRLVWIYGLSHNEFVRYAKKFYKLSQDHPDIAFYPEALLQRVDDNWITELPSASEALFYRINSHYARSLLSRLGDRTGNTLELLCEYLMSCMPGCRTRRRERSGGTEYDIICAMEGLEVDFRSEFGRHFICECKDWDKPADFATMAKFCRVLDSTKSRFGILFSKKGITGTAKTSDAAREQLKIFQDRGAVIVVVDECDLNAVADGANLISLLRGRYETVRLDLFGTQSSPLAARSTPPATGANGSPKPGEPLTSPRDQSSPEPASNIDPVPVLGTGKRRTRK